MPVGRLAVPNVVLVSAFYGYLLYGVFAGSVPSENGSAVTSEPC